jgi:competence protein ComEC
LRVITIAAAAMVWQNPMILRFDIGFQLSFMAVAGMAYFSMPIQLRLDKFIRYDFINSALATSLAAQIFTLPILIYNFGYISTYSLIANVLVEPIVSFMTIFGFIMAIAGAINSALGWLLAVPLWLANSYLLSVADIFSGLPGAKLVYRIDFIWFLTAYAVLGAVVWKINERNKLRFLD